MSDKERQRSELVKREVESPSMVLKCLMCGREAGQIKGGKFTPKPDNPPVKRRDRYLCGSCGGYLFVDTEQRYIEW